MLSLAVDVGGTFTDAVAVEQPSGRIYVVKTKSTPRAPEEGLVSAVVRMLSMNELRAADVKSMVHVSTIGTNLFLGQLGISVPRVGLVTTRGFRDVIEIGRQNRAELYNLDFQRPKPLVPRKYRFEASERVAADGEILRRVQKDEVLSIGSKLGAHGIESVAICFLNSYVNPANENDAKLMLTAGYHGPVFASSEIDPEHREYERTTTTVVNAVLAPVISNYLDKACRHLHDAGFNASFQILSSSGGIVDLEEVRVRPIVAIESGPAAGVVGAAEYARRMGVHKLISLDMGGTSAKAGSVVDYTPLVVPEVEVGGRVHMGRHVKGSGYPVKYPCVDLAEVSAGGGTIVWVDGVGSLKVGPISAGSEPGPACYSLGGENATITDANLLLGRLGTLIVGGELSLSKEMAQTALAHVARQASMDLLEVAASSLALVNLQMARAIDIVSLERGYDPREFTLFAFGGAGPMHAAELADQVGIRSVIIPPLPGLFSALSMLMTDAKYAFVQGIVHALDDVSEQSLENEFSKLSEDAIAKLKERGVDLAGVSVKRTADLRYFGQGYELETEVGVPFSKKEAANAFEKKHEAVFGYRHAGEGVEITALRITLTIPIEKPKLGFPAQRHSDNRQVPDHRRVWFGGEWIDTAVLWRNDLEIDQTIQGPAIIEGYDSTIVVPPSWTIINTKTGCMFLRRCP